MSRRAVCLVLVAAVFAAWLCGVCLSQPPGPREGMRGDPTLCIYCHPSQAQALKDTAHTRSYQSKAFQARLAGATDPKHCLSCHAPRPVLGTGIDRPPQPMEEEPVRGIGCDTCHTDGAWAQVGPLPVGDSSAHPTVEDPSLHTAPDLCGRCHGPAEPSDDQVTSWAASQWARDGRSCQSCHMPRMTGIVSYATRRTHREVALHSFRGAEDMEFVRDAVALTVSVEGNAATATLDNRRVGHMLPGGAGPRMVMHLSALDAKAATLASGEAAVAWDGTGKDSRLAPGASTSLHLTVPAGARSVRATLVYEPTEGEAREVASAERAL